MAEKYEQLGFTATVTNQKLKVEIPISNLVKGFEASPNNFDEVKVKRGHKQAFAKYLAQHLIDGSNPDTGESPIMEVIEQIFEEIFEGAEDFIKYPEEDEE